MRASATRTIASAAVIASRPSGSPTCVAIARLRGLDVEPLPACRRSGAAALMRPSTTCASVSVGRSLPCAVADRARHRAGAFRADLQQAAAIDRGDRAAAGADGRDLDHRRADHEAEIDRGLRRERRLAAGDHRDVERRAAEIAGDDVVEAGGLARSPPPAMTPAAGPDSAVRTGRRARGRGRHDAAVRLHDVELRRRSCRSASAASSLAR